MRRLVAILASLLLLSACTDSHAPEAAPTPAVSESATTTPTLPPVVPNLVGLPVDEAVRQLRAAGLRPSSFWVANATCAGDDVVVRQRPRAGRQAEPKQRVRILADRLPCQPLRRRTQANAEDTRLADAFIGFARGERPVPPVSDRVLFFLGGGPAGEVPATQANDRKGWRMCPPEKYYAAGSCPFDVLHVLVYSAVNGFPLVYSPEPRGGACIVESSRADLSPVQHLHRVVVSPAARVANCASDFLLELYYDRGRIAAVGLSLSEP